MSIESYSQILEEELSEAVEVKNPKSLHRYIVLLSENLVEKRQYHEEQTGIKSDLKEMMLLMRERFEAMDKRFEDMQQQMNVRFEAVDKRFDDMNSALPALPGLSVSGLW